MVDRNEILSKLKYFIEPNRENVHNKIWYINWNMLNSLSCNGVFPFQHRFKNFNESPTYVRLDHKKIYSYMLDLLNKNNIDIIDVIYSILLVHMNMKIIISTYDNIYIYVFLNQNSILIYNLSDPNDGILLYNRSDSSYKTIPRNKFLLIKCSLTELSNNNLFPDKSIYLKKSKFPKKYNIFKNTEHSMILSFLYYLKRCDFIKYNQNILFNNYNSDDFLQDIEHIYRLCNRQSYIMEIYSYLKIFNITKEPEAFLTELYFEKENLIQLLNCDKNMYNKEIHKTFYISENI